MSQDIISAYSTGDSIQCSPLFHNKYCQLFVTFCAQTCLVSWPMLMVQLREKAYDTSAMSQTRYVHSSGPKFSPKARSIGLGFLASPITKQATIGLVFWLLQY